MTTKPSPLITSDALALDLYRVLFPAPRSDRHWKKFLQRVKPVIRDSLAWNGAERGTCKWTDEGEYWNTSCNATWTFIDGGPKENDVAFCHGCGKKVEIDDDE